MAKKKKYKGHYCKVCGSIKANEQFTGKGHASHICKKCSEKTGAQQAEEIAISRIYKLVKYSNLSKQNRKMLQTYLNDRRENVKLASQEVMGINDEIFCEDLEDNDEFLYYDTEEEDSILGYEDLDDIPF